MQQQVTVKDIAQGAEVSIATVSRVLNNHANINDDIRKRVLQVAAELGYEKNEKPLRARGKSLKEIGFILTHNDQGNLDLFWTPILHGVENEASKSKLRFTYQGVSAAISAMQMRHQIQEMRADGILLVGPFTVEVVKAVYDLEIPCVLIDNAVRLEGYPIDAVLSDNVSGIKDAMAYLIAEGHREIAFMGGYTNTLQNIYTFRQRKYAYIESLEEHGLPFQKELLCETEVTSSDHIFEACQQLIKQRPTVSAIICVNDPTALFAMKALKELGKKIPDDISIIGFDDILFGEHLNPALTSVHVHGEQMGRLALRRLIERNNDPGSIGLQSLVDTQLIKRESVIPHIS